MSVKRPRCAVVRGDGHVDRLEADGVISPGDADALRDFAAFLRGEITAAQLDERTRP